MTQSNKVRAAYTGTFDPITNGHADVIHRAASMFDDLIVAIANNTSKKPIFGLDERLELAREVMADVPNVVVMPVEGLIIDFAREHNIRVLVRGVRGFSDYEYERQMATMNRHLEPTVDTVLLAPAPEFAHISSTLVREIAFLDGHIDGLVPTVVAERLRQRTG